MPQLKKLGKKTSAKRRLFPKPKGMEEFKVSYEGIHGHARSFRIYAENSAEADKRIKELARLKKWMRYRIG